MRYKRNPPLPVFTWLVDSKSRPGMKHKVSWYEQDIPGWTINHWRCDCEGFNSARKAGHYCSHIRRKVHEFGGLEIDLTEVI